MTLGCVSRLCPLVLDGFLMAPNKDSQKGWSLKEWLQIGIRLVHFPVVFGTFLLLMAEIRLTS